MQFVLTLPESSTQPMYRQVCESLKQAILSGRLKPGEKLPSSRDLADSINLSRFTIIRSYEELSSQGYIQTISGSGTFVIKDVPKQHTDFRDTEFYGVENADLLAQAGDLSAWARNVMENESIEDSLVELFPELNYGAPSAEHLPLTRWRELVNRHARANEAAVVSYKSDPFGYRPLREAIAGYLIRSRSVRCTPEQVVIFSGGTQSALDLIGRILLRHGDLAAVENPGYAGARRSLIMNGANLFAVPVDQHGLDVDRLYNANSKVRLCYVTPSHQDPTGVVLSMARRLQLLKWAERTGGYVIEDDHDSEFRFGDKPLPSLQGLDENERVIYISSFWKTLFPIVKVGFAVIPKQLVELFWRAKSLIERDFPLLEQRALTDFIQEGHLERQIRRTRSLYAKRRAALVQALTRQFRKNVTVCGTGSGMHLRLRFAPELCKQGLMRCARAADVPLVSTGSHYLNDPHPGEFLIGFAHADEQTIHETIARFAQGLAAESVLSGPSETGSLALSPNAYALPVRT